METTNTQAGAPTHAEVADTVALLRRLADVLPACVHCDGTATHTATSPRGLVSPVCDEHATHSRCLRGYVVLEYGYAPPLREALSLITRIVALATAPPAPAPACVACGLPLPCACEGGA